MKKIATFSVLLAGTFLSFNAYSRLISPETTGISFGVGSKTDYNFMAQGYDSKGDLITEYYKINFDDQLSYNNTFFWNLLDSKPADMSNVIEINLPNNDIRYYGYEVNYNHQYSYKEYHNNHTSTNDYFAYGRSVNPGSYSSSNYNFNFYDFVNNSVEAKLEARGGAVFGGSGDLLGSFIGNHAKGEYAYGGAIDNVGTLDYAGEIFISNYAEGTYSAHGGAIDNFGKIGSVYGHFIDNYALSKDSVANGGAIYNYGIINRITGDFIYNRAVSLNYDAKGGAIYNGKQQSQQMPLNFRGNLIANYAQAKGIARGGAIYTADNISGLFYDGIFTDNYTEDKRGKIYNAIYVDTSSKTPYVYLIVDNHLIINDNMENGKYGFGGSGKVNLETGTTNTYISVNNAIINAERVDVVKTTLRFGAFQHEDKSAKNWDGKGKFISALDAYGNEVNGPSVTSLILTDAVFDIHNGYLETVKLKNYTSERKTNNFIHLDVDVDKMKSDVINVNGDVDGITKLVIHATSDKDIRGQGKILFAESTGDGFGHENSFEVARVYKSPYLYDIVYESTKSSTGTKYSNDNSWYLEMNDVYNPDSGIPQPLGPIEVVPEVVATVAVKTAGLSQTNGMVYNIMRKVGVNRLFCPGCGFYDYNWDGEAFHNVWVDTTYNGLTIEAPVEIDAKVWGIEAGSDLQHDLNNKLGIFVSYRQGNYEMDGKGEKYYSNIGSEIDIDSYLAGLYYRYDYNDWYAFATVYGGKQNAEIQTDDGAANYDTDGIEFGGSIEAGYNYALTRKLSVTPSLGAFYSQISYDDATDNVGKTVNYNDLKQVELEAGAKFAYTQYTDDGFYSLYVKPSVVQTLIDGDEIEVTKLGKVDTVEDKTLGRVELGGNIGFNDNWSAYGWANYTFGSDYEATSLGLGLNYAW